MCWGRGSEGGIGQFFRYLFLTPAGGSIPAGQWHTVKALESGSVILEMKEGAYEPIGPEDFLSL